MRDPSNYTQICKIALHDATRKLIDDKEVKKEDAEGVVGAEIRNKPDLATHPGGVAESMTTAASNLNKF
ncbi:hypothetical protein RND71_023006 [Anisodus tanguticus]|uniref:SMP domain-containing protein n=1 Tax=Anisodus tanguticus TaxID=243964 RepID=A0AAE1RUR4_9SOLA|nr:hypothetical protein RND71_023006 [Anisodus tanguticus]